MRPLQEEQKETKKICYILVYAYNPSKWNYLNHPASKQSTHLCPLRLAIPKSSPALKAIRVKWLEVKRLCTNVGTDQVTMLAHPTPMRHWVLQAKAFSGPLLSFRHKIQLVTQVGHLERKREVTFPTTDPWIQALAFYAMLSAGRLYFT